MRPEALDIARGAVHGEGIARGALPGEGRARPLPADPLLHGLASPAASARTALEAAMVPALQRSPCLVTFSGGRDSSAVLAVAVGVARKLGLPEPVPVTRYFPGAPATDESQWQELVVRHLGVAHWERVAFDEMDVVGPTCTPSLLARGPLWPPLIHTWPPIFELARGGAVLTGEGGDELFNPVRCTVLKWLAADPRRAARPGAVREAFQAIAPKAWRRRQAISRVREVVPGWLLPGPAHDYLQELVSWETDEPLSWRRSTARLTGDRSHQVGLHNFAVLAAEYSLALVHPLHDPAFVLGCGRQAGRMGYPGRTAAMRALFGADLPDAVLRRTDKVFMNKVMLSSSTRAFAATWSGRGVSADLVDAEVLRACWRHDDIPVTSVLALQAGWCADHRDEGRAAPAATAPDC